MLLNKAPATANAGTALYLMFKIEADYYALAATQIEFVLRRQRLKRIPAAPQWMAGLLNVNGQVVPVMDLYQRLLDRPASAQSSTRLVVVRYAPGRLLGLLLEKVNTFERLSLSAWTPATIELQQNKFLAGVQQHASLGLIQNIELGQLLPDDIKQQLFAELPDPAANASQASSTTTVP